MENLVGRIIQTLAKYSLNRSNLENINLSEDWKDWDNPWGLYFEFDTEEHKKIQIRHLKKNDIETLRSFRNNLSETSKDLFCPYPWNDEDKINTSFQEAIDKAANKKDVSYVILHEGETIGHFFLWAAGGNEHSKKYDLEIPELGVAIADTYHGKGLGRLSVNLLQDIAIILGRDAIELTTAMTNNAGWNTYLNASFEYTGIIKNPLEVDVTAATQGKVEAHKFREERQMAYIINEDKRKEILDYLALKRIEAEQ